MPTQYSDDLIASILAESEYTNDETTAKRWGISTRTLRRYRAKSAESDTLSHLVQLKKQLLASKWIDDVGEAMCTAIAEVKRRVQCCNTEDDAKCLHAVSGSLKILGDLKVSYEAIFDPQNEQG